MGKEEENLEENVEENLEEGKDKEDSKGSKDGKDGKDGDKKTITRKVPKTGLEKDLEDVPKIKVILAIFAGTIVTASALVYSNNLLKTYYAIIMGIVVFYILGMFIESMVTKQIKSHYALIEAEKERVRQEELERKQEEERLLLLERENQIKLEAEEAQARARAEMAQMQAQLDANGDDFEDEKIADAIKQAIS